MPAGPTAPFLAQQVDRQSASPAHGLPMPICGEADSGAEIDNRSEPDRTAAPARPVHGPRGASHETVQRSANVESTPLAQFTNGGFDRLDWQTGGGRNCLDRGDTIARPPDRLGHAIQCVVLHCFCVEEYKIVADALPGEIAQGPRCWDRSGLVGISCFAPCICSSLIWFSFFPHSFQDDISGKRSIRYRPFIDFVARMILALSHRASGAFSALGGKAVFRAYSRLSVRQFRSTRAHSAKVSDRSGDSIDWTGKNLFALRGNQWLREGPRHAAEQSHRAGRDVVDLHIEHGTIAAIEPTVHRERDEPSTCENGCSCPVRPMRTRIWTKP